MLEAFAYHLGYAIYTNRENTKFWANVDGVTARGESLRSCQLDIEQILGII